MQHLAIDQGYLGMLHDITDDDLKVAGDLTDERRFGQWSDALPWFWVQLMLVVHECRNVCIPVCYDVILLIRLQFIE